MIQPGEQYRQFIEDALETKLSKDAQFLGVVTQSGGHGVVAFDNYTKYDIELMYAGKQFLSRTLLAVVFNYIFQQLKCHRCTSRIQAGNDKAVHIAERLGFVPEGVIRQAHEGKDVLIHGMLKSECRYLTNG